MANKTGKGGWKKGKSGNPKGRPPILLPEIQREIDQNRNALKQLIIRYLSLTQEQIEKRLGEPDTQSIEFMLAQCILRIGAEGNTDSFRKLLEIPFGKLPEEQKEFEVSPEERLMILTYRKRLEDERESKPALEDSAKRS